MKDCNIDCGCGGRNANCRKCGGKGYYTPDDLQPPHPLTAAPKVPSLKSVVVPAVSLRERLAQLELGEYLALKKKQALKKKRVRKQKLLEKELAHMQKLREKYLALKKKLKRKK